MQTMPPPWLQDYERFHPGESTASAPRNLTRQNTPDWARRPNLGYSLATLPETFESDSSSYRELSRLCEEPTCAFH